MHTPLQDISQRLRVILTNPAFLIASVAVLVLGAANAALLSFLHAYVQPDHVATGVIAAVDLVRIVITIYLGMPPIC